MSKCRWLLSAAAAVGFAVAGTSAHAQKVVNIWHTEPNAATKAAVDEIIKDFEKANPGIKIVQEAIGWGDLDKKMQAALASTLGADSPGGCSVGVPLLDRQEDA